MPLALASPAAVSCRSALRSSQAPSRLAVPSRAAPSSRRMAASRLVVSASADGDFDGYKPNVAFLFPGQGAQYVGMAKSLVAEVPAAADLFKKASDILGYDLLKVCVEGPKEKLDTTAVSQPAIYVASLAAVEKLKMTEEGKKQLAACNVAAGLSLGEYTALAYAGAFSFEDGLKLVKLRGESMQAAADAKPSSMASVIGLDAATVEALCKKATEQAGAGQYVRIANYLCPGNYAVSGSTAAVEVVEKIAKPDFKARMVVRLAVAGAFHTDFMAPAVEKLQAALAATPMKKPSIPVISNVDGKPHSDPAAIKAILAKQVTSPVMWEASLSTLLEKGMAESFEIGPGKVISGIMKRINKDAKITNIEA